MRRALALGTATACMAVLMVVHAAGPVAAYPSSNVVIAGHGWGHGRGMGQYGALGYALRGAPYTDILQHFYSNTTAGTIPAGAISVELVAAGGKDAIIYQPSQPPSVNGSVAPTKAMLVRKTGPNTFDIYYSSGCAGPWPASPN